MVNSSWITVQIKSLRDLYDRFVQGDPAYAGPALKVAADSMAAMQVELEAKTQDNVILATRLNSMKAELMSLCQDIRTRHCAGAHWAGCEKEHENCALVVQLEEIIKGIPDTSKEVICLPFNVNHYVRVKLTETGRKAFSKKAYELFGERSGRFIEMYTQEDAEGWSQWQLWELMQWLGSECGNGMEVPLETEIQIVVRPS